MIELKNNCFKKFELAVGPPLPHPPGKIEIIF